MADFILISSCLTQNKQMVDFEGFCFVLLLLLFCHIIPFLGNLFPYLSIYFFTYRCLVYIVQFSILFFCICDCLSASICVSYTFVWALFPSVHLALFCFFLFLLYPLIITILYACLIPNDREVGRLYI